MHPEEPEAGISAAQIVSILDQMYVTMFGFKKTHNRSSPGFFTVSYETPAGETITVTYDDGRSDAGVPD